MEDALNKARAERNSLVKEALMIRKYHAGELTEKKAMNQLHALYKDKDEELRPTTVPSEARLGVIKLEKQCCVVKIASLKEQLLQLLKRHTGVRELRPEELSVQHIVSVFDSALTRALKMDINGLYNDIIIVKTYFFDVFKNIVEDGFTYQGDRYVLLTASAGQIRTKKSVFIKEKRLQEVQDVISCGLSVDDINAHGGVNVNKYLAYLALSNSATDVIPWFDVDRCIVVDDLETTVTSMVDFVDEKTYTVHRQEMSFPITHTDGCGMILPSASKKNFMIRLPWIKGLLAVFPFDKFINQANMYKNDGNSAKIKDIYGETHDILAENINIIFTKSQFKMWKYYSSWDEYKEKFKRFGCTAGMCNEEDDKIQDAKINYQMLQTLTDLREDELEHIVGKTAYKISSISSDRETMLRVFGATTKNQHKNYFQQCLLLYPELLQDEYCRDMLRSIKGSLEKEAWSGRVDVYGKYTFVVPDMFAFCQHLFCGEAIPTGLLKNGEVYCRLFRAPELDCLRSPHLYREHAIRTNVAPEKQEMAEWFCTDAIYTSIEDNISKILMFDCDGDKLLVCADKVLVQAAKRNMEGIVPLYYEMAKAGSMPLTPTVMYNGMIAAYTGGNIGQISNDITKVWNNPEPDLEVIKLLCMENNFTIDYAKTLYKPARPLEAEKRITEATRRQLPHYFIWAKDKREDQVAPPGTGCVDKILDMIPKGRLRFDQKKNGKLNYHLLMQNWRLDMEEEKAKEVLSTYKDAVADIGTVMYFSEDQQDNSNYILGQLRDKLTTIAPMEYVTDVLVKHLFHQKHTPRKVVFWNLCGEQVLKNLQANISTKTFYCVSCGKRVVRRHPNQTRCDQCAADRRKAYNAEKQREYRRKKRESCTPLSQ